MPHATGARWRYAQAKEVEYQERKAARMAGHEAVLAANAEAHSSEVFALLERLGYAPGAGQTIEIGSGAHGLIWRWPSAQRIAIDPLAHFYRGAFAGLQADGPLIVTAKGERLPVPADAADVLLSDNVLDHVEDPCAFLAECARVLKPGGVFYCTVDVHHPIYGVGARAYDLLFASGLRLNVPAYPNHPFHFTEPQVDRLFGEAGFEVRRRAGGTAAVASRASAPATGKGGVQAVIKKFFYKNVLLELVATHAQLGK